MPYHYNLKGPVLFLLICAALFVAILSTHGVLQLLSSYLFGVAQVITAIVVGAFLAE